MLGVPLPPPHGPSQSPTVYKSTTANAFKASLFQAFRWWGQRKKKCEQETQQEVQFRASLHYLNDWNRLLYLTIRYWAI